MRNLVLATAFALTMAAAAAVPAQGLQIVRATVTVPAAGVDCTVTLTDGTHGDNTFCTTPLGTCTDNIMPAPYWSDRYEAFRGCVLTVEQVEVICTERAYDIAGESGTVNECGVSRGATMIGCSREDEIGGSHSATHQNARECVLAVDEGPVQATFVCHDDDTNYPLVYNDYTGCTLEALSAQAGVQCDSRDSHYEGGSDGGECTFTTPGPSGTETRTFCTRPVFVGNLGILIDVSVAVPTTLEPAPPEGCFKPVY